MTNNPIELVREAELEAEATIKNAAREAEQIIENSKNQAAELIRSSEENAHMSAADKIAAAHEENQKAMEAVIAKQKEQIADLTEKVRMRQPKAIEMILEALT